MKRSKLESHDVQVRPQRTAEAQDAVRRLGELVRGIRVAMLTTVRPGGHFRSRPLMTQESELDDELWFFIDSRSSISDEITECHQVDLVYVDHGKDRYVSISGVAQVLREPDLMRRYWNHRAAEWFPNGPDNDPFLALLRVQLEEAEYWDGTSKTMVRMRGLDASNEREVPVGRPPEGEPPFEAPTRES